MKNLNRALGLVAAIFILVSSVSADDVKYPLVGEWTKSTNNAHITKLKFSLMAC